MATHDIMTAASPGDGRSEFEHTDCHFVLLSLLVGAGGVGHNDLGQGNAICCILLIEILYGRLPYYQGYLRNVILIVYFG